MCTDNSDVNSTDNKLFVGIRQ